MKNAMKTNISCNSNSTLEKYYYHSKNVYLYYYIISMKTLSQHPVFRKNNSIQSIYLTSSLDGWKYLKAKIFKNRIRLNIFNTIGRIRIWKKKTKNLIMIKFHQHSMLLSWYRMVFKAIISFPYFMKTPGNY